VDFSLSESVAIGEAVAEAYRPKAEEKEKSGKGANDSGGATCPRGSRDETARTNEQAASVAGMKRRTYEKAQAVIEAAKAEPKRFKSLVEEMDRTGKANGVYKKLKNIKAADAICREPPPLPEGPFRVIAATHLRDLPLWRLLVVLADAERVFGPNDPMTRRFAEVVQARLEKESDAMAI